MFDLIIKKGTIMDGAGEESYKADIGIIKDTIVKIGDLKGYNSIKEIDAEGLVVSPGFIDIHSHSDLGLLAAPFEKNKLMQGVTTEVGGHCGYSLYPIIKDKRSALQSLVEASNLNIDIDWCSTEDFLNKLEEEGIGANLVPLVGHGVLRMNVMGFEAREASQEEIHRMNELLAKAMEEGAFGLSTGLGYPPGCFADTNELIELSRTVSKYKGIYATHLRNQGDKLLESITESIEIGKKAGVSVDISHLKASKKRNWGKIDDALKLIEHARKDGVNIICDFYPYDAAEGPLSALFPNWLHEGGVSKLIERLSLKKTREKVKHEMNFDDDYWSRIIVSDIMSEKNKSLQGKSIKEIGDIKNDDAFETAVKLLIEEEGAVSTVCKIMSEKDVIQVAKYPYAAVGSDAFALPEGIKNFKGHPRNFGTFPRFLGRFIREKDVITFEEGIRRMTSLPAEFLGIRNRGLIEEGKYADIVIFDKNEIIDKNNFENPLIYPIGIEYVIVNGHIQVEEGKLNKIPCGMVIRKNSIGI
ncbi:N-acyl-D-amino-acid deacylase family protein [Wukongibacter sp. M2B1]|uniref:N-acyl-D-amino-acid deacylase family protein n=1 Tax=Wukongibacter sp. M2B1 TaxID=3088895 RepID=UPI003D79112C